MPTPQAISPSDLVTLCRAAADRFWSKVKKAGEDECWLWTGAKDQNGYGCFMLRGTRKAPRVSWMITHGEIPVGQLACHICDRPACCNPKHLFLGSPLENMQDCVGKGRSAKGEAHSQRVLSEGDVTEIGLAFERGESSNSIAKKYGITDGAIRRIRRGEGWRHISLHRSPYAGKFKKKLTVADASEILRRLAEGETGRSIARKYGVTPAAICSIKRGRNFAKLPRSAVAA